MCRRKPPVKVPSNNGQAAPVASSSARVEDGGEKKASPSHEELRPSISETIQEAPMQQNSWNSAALLTAMLALSAAAFALSPKLLSVQTADADQCTAEPQSKLPSKGKKSGSSKQGKQNQKQGAPRQDRVQPWLPKAMVGAALVIVLSLCVYGLSGESRPSVSASPKLDRLLKTYAKAMWNSDTSRGTANEQILMSKWISTMPELRQYLLLYRQYQKEAAAPVLKQNLDVQACIVVARIAYTFGFETVYDASGAEEAVVNQLVSKPFKQRRPIEHCLVAAYRRPAERNDGEWSDVEKMKQLAVRYPETSTHHRVYAMGTQQLMFTDWYTKLEDALEAGQARVKACMGKHNIPKEPRPTDDMSAVRIKPKETKGAQPTGAMITNVFTKAEIAAIKLLQKCVDQNVPEAVKKRNFGGGGYRDGHSTIFVQNFWDWELPQLKARVLAAAQHAVNTLKWNETVTERPDKLGLRVAEVLQYSDNGGLGWHRDTGSVYTMVVNLANPGDFEGGELLLHTSEMNGNARIEEQQTGFGPLAPGGDGAIFLSNEPHKVTAVTSGERLVLVTELWEFGDAVHLDRPDPHGQLQLLGQAAFDHREKAMRGTTHNQRLRMSRSTYMMDPPDIDLGKIPN